MSLEKKLRTVLGAQTTKKSVHAGAILDVLELAQSDDERAQLLAIVLIERDAVQKQVIVLDNKDTIDDRWDLLNNTHYDLVMAHLKMSFFTTNNAHDFAHKILALMGQFKIREEKLFVLGTTLFSTPYIPYKELPGVPKKLPQAQVVHLLESHQDDVSMLKYISELPFTLIEEAGLVLQLLDNTENAELRQALLSFYVRVHIERERNNSK